MSTPPAILVLDGRQRAALAITRSLCRRGIAVHCAEAAGEFSLAAHARGVAGRHTYSPPGRCASAFVEDVRALAERTGCRWIWPVTDATTMLLCDAPDLGPRLIAAPRPAYVAASDKAALTRRAQALDVPVPETRIVEGRGDIETAANELGYPCVLKPARSKFLAGDEVHGTTVHVIASPGMLAGVLADAAWLGHMPGLVQRFVPGHGEGVFCLFDGQDAVAWFAHRRLREKPPGGGVSVLSEAVAPDPQLQQHARRLLADIGYRGIAMVEFRVTPEGRPHLMEINARPWGSLQLAIDAGIDFPWLQYCLQEGMPTPPVSPVPARLRWWLGDLDCLLLQLRRPLPGTSRLAAVRAFAATTFDGRARNEVLRWGDPAPGIAEIGAWLRRV